MYCENFLSTPTYQMRQIRGHKTKQGSVIGSYHPNNVSHQGNTRTPPSVYISQPSQLTIKRLISHSFILLTRPTSHPPHRSHHFSESQRSSILDIRAPTAPRPTRRKLDSPIPITRHAIIDATDASDFSHTRGKRPVRLVLCAARPHCSGKISMPCALNRF